MHSGNSVRQVWQIAAGDAMRSYTDVFLTYGVALIGPGWAGRWTQDAQDDAFEGSYVRRFASEVTIGDAIVLRRGVANIVAIGLVASDYSFEEAFDDVAGWDLQHARRVRWCHLPKEQDFGKAVFGANPSRFSRVHSQEVVDFVIRFLNSPPTGWQSAPVPPLPAAEPNLEEIPPALSWIVAQARDLEPHYWDADRFGERPSEHEMVAHFVVPFVRALGWPVEQIAVEWRSVDVVIFHTLPRRPENCRFVIEAKRFGDGIEGARAQARSYVTALGTSCDVVVTDGMRYRLYAREKDFAEAGYANLAHLKRSAVELFNYMSKAGGG